MASTYEVGYFNGVLDVYYAKMSTEDSAAAAPTYGTPAVLGKSIEVTITPQFREGSLYASNARVRNVNVLDSYEVSLNVDQVVASVRRDILGRTADNKGVETLDGGDNAPYVAIGFAVTKDNGTKELWWLYKGKFSEIEKTAATANDSIEYQTPTLSAVFDRRIYDDKLAAVLDTEAEDADETTANGWFTAVYETGAAVVTPPAQQPAG